MMISPYVFPGVKLEYIPEIKNKHHLKSRITPEEVMNIVAQNHGITSIDILSRVRKREICDARHMFCAIMKKQFRYSLKSIGGMVSGRDHTTAIHSIRTFNNRCKNEEGYKQLSESIISQILSKI